MERTYTAKNGVCEKTRFLVGAAARPRRKKEKVSSERKQESNRYTALHQLARLLNNNFRQNDIFISPTYTQEALQLLRNRAEKKLKADAGEEQRYEAILNEARRDGTNFMRRMRRLAGAAGEHIKSLMVVSDMDGSTGELTEVHLHIVMSADAFCMADIEGEGRQFVLGGKTVKEIWGNGNADYELLRKGDLTPLADYLLRQVRNIPNRKKYTASRNCEKIVPSERIVENGGKEIKLDKGCTVLKRHYDRENPGAQYVRYIKPEKKKKIGGHKEGLTGWAEQNE